MLERKENNYHIPGSMENYLKAKFSDTFRGDNYYNDDTILTSTYV